MKMEEEVKNYSYNSSDGYYGSVSSCSIVAAREKKAYS